MVVGLFCLICGLFLGFFTGLYIGLTIGSKSKTDNFGIKLTPDEADKILKVREINEMIKK